jgi:hypothetical protein
MHSRLQFPSLFAATLILAFASGVAFLMDADDWTWFWRGAAIVLALAAVAMALWRDALISDAFVDAADGALDGLHKGEAL